MRAVLTAVLHFCMNYIPYGCSADRCTSLLYVLHSIWPQCWPLYLTSLWTTFRMAAVLTAVPHFCMYYISYGCSADSCTSHLYELYSIWLQCWPLYLTSVLTAFHMVTVLTAVPLFCSNYIPCGCSADRCTSLLFELHRTWLKRLPLYPTSVWNTFHKAAVLTAVTHFCLNWIPYGSSAERCTSRLS